MIPITSYLRRIALTAGSASYYSEGIKNKYGIDISSSYDPYLLRQMYLLLSELPTKLVRDCGFNVFYMRDDMGPNKPYYPNHGYYVNESVTLNSDCFYHPDRPDDFVDGNGYYMYRPAQTLYHEMGHSFDDFHEKEGVPLSQQDAWLKLSGWSENFKLGLQRLIIKDKGAPEVIGEWFYDPKAGFTRFYARRNPWDDWADSFSFFVGGMKKLPDNKQEYFEKLLGKYYGK